MRHFINATDAIVAEALDGLLLSSADRGLARLDGYPEIKVVLRANRDPKTVAVVSGGGSGHEPAHTGFVGEGLLDAAVCGDIFASPTVDAVFAAILSVTGPAGCLLIVKNYVGDRLNFGLAAERARALGRQVEMVIVADDVAIPDNPRPRGIAGTIFVHKAAGYAAQRGLSLAQVRAAAEDAARSVRSLGVATSMCSIPGRVHEDRIGPGEAELGLGIHGEPGAVRIALPAAADLVTEMLGRFGPEIQTAPRLALLVNNLGGVPALEMAIIVREILRSSIGARIEWILGPAPAVTALDMRGFSLSLMPIGDETVTMLTAPVGVPAWPIPRQVAKTVRILPLPAELSSTPEQPSENAAARGMLESICTTLMAAQADLDGLDARVGDGDTGSTFATAARRIYADLDALPLAHPGALCRALSERLSRVMGGSSGVLLSTFVAAVGVALTQGADLATALLAGAARVQHYGGARAGDRTMLDALLPAIETLAAGRDLASAAAAARIGADGTANMPSARAGRASYVGSTDLLGVVDPGAEAVARVFGAVASAGAM
ncbi:DAK2 domain-containing protein [Oleomonas cavernae]|uniref:DAK2 domain-containing protein n=1 Tax=Oleomonas cavernae TaxID=2320859 RepID=A0A418WA25_9PROT|nr:dihydroxyacetone kinase subunit DhaK [Oleomonas cavernae]RJF86794.1 DAK2 domain-containing protein [Oleomonas cavernae]